MDFVEEGYWDKSYEKLNLDFSTVNDPVYKLVQKFVTPDKHKNVLEIGCFPGRYLKAFGDLGYELNGVDTTPRTQTSLKDFLVGKGYLVGNLTKDSIFEFKPDKTFDIVCSFGFIEHFDKWPAVIDLHLKHLKKGGVLIITVPNFAGAAQQLFHRLFDKKNLRRHNLKSMNTEAWLKHICAAGYKYTTQFAGPFGDIDFWVDEEPVSKWKMKLKRRWIYVFNKIKSRNPAPSNIYSPYLGIVLKIEE